MSWLPQERKLAIATHSRLTTCPSSGQLLRHRGRLHLPEQVPAKESALVTRARAEANVVAVVYEVPDLPIRRSGDVDESTIGRAVGWASLPLNVSGQWRCRTAADGGGRQAEVIPMAFVEHPVTFRSVQSSSLQPLGAAGALDSPSCCRGTYERRLARAGSSLSRLRPACSTCPVRPLQTGKVVLGTQIVISALRQALLHTVVAPGGWPAVR